MMAFVTPTKFINPKFYDMEMGVNIQSKYTKNVALQLLDGNYLVGVEPYGNSQKVEKIDRTTGTITTVYTHPTPIRLEPMHITKDGIVLLLAFDYPYNNHRIFKSTDANLTNFVEVQSMNWSKPYSKHSICENKTGTILWGEYVGSYGWSEPDAPTQSKIWRSTDNGATWDNPFSFERNNSLNIIGIDYVQHIHYIEYDEFTDLFWVGTGDTDSESTMWTTPDGEVLTLVNRGYLEDVFGVDNGQYWRSTSMTFHEDCVVWGCDGFKDGTWVLRYDRVTEELIITSDVRTAGYMFFSGVTTLLTGERVSFFGNTGSPSTIYYTDGDNKTLKLLHAFTGEDNRVKFTNDDFGGEGMIFNGNGNLTLNGETINSGIITFNPKSLILKFLENGV